MASDSIYPPISIAAAETGSGQFQESGEDGGHVPLLRHYFNLLVRWKWLVAGIVGAALLIALVITALATPQYTASTRIEISRQQKKITNVSGLEAEISTFDTEFYSTQYSLLRARSLAQRVVTALRLDRDPAFMAAHGMSLDQADERGSAVNRLRARSTLAEDLLLDNIEIAPVRGSSLVDIRYRSADPAQSARISDAWAEQFIQTTVANRFASTADARKFLEQRLESLRQRLEQSERDLVNYANSNKIVMLASEETPEGKTRTVRTLATSNVEVANAELARATADRIAVESRARRGGTPSQFASQNVGLSSLRQRRAEIGAEYQRLLIQFDPEYPRARELKAQLAELDSSIQRDESRIVDTFSGQLREAREREEAVRARVGTLQEQLDKERRASIQYSIYQREVDTNRELFDALLQRYKEIGVAGVEASNIAIVDKAQVPESPSSPSLMLNLMLGLMGGLIVAAGTLFIIEHIDEGVRDPSLVPRDLGVPLLGTVFKMGEDDLLDQLADPKSMVSEAYTSVRSMLRMSTSHGLPYSFMLCSTTKGEGKSTSAIAISTSIARAGFKVVLIDADMRAPTLHMRLGLSGDAGLSNYLAGEGSAPSLCQSTAIENLSVMTSGPMPPNPADLLSGDGVARLIAELREVFDYVVIDAPPTLGLADALMIGSAVEGAIYVVEAKREPIRAVKTSINRLRSGGLRIFGAVITKLDPRDANLAYGYGYGYGHQYGYGHDRKG